MRSAEINRRYPKRPDDMFRRTWILTCDECEHVGEVSATKRQLRRWVAEEKLVCAECGCIKKAAEKPHKLSLYA